MKTIQNLPVKGYIIRCTTDNDLSFFDLPVDLPNVLGLLSEVRNDYPKDTFQLVAIIDA